jgi:hypothetical protein
MGVDLENQPAEFVVTENDIQSISKDFGTSGIPDIKSGARLIIKSKQSGVPFEVFNASSTGSTGKITITETSGVGALPAFAANDAEEKTFVLDLRDNQGRTQDFNGNNIVDDNEKTGYVLNGNDSVSIELDGEIVTYRPSQDDINNAPMDLSNPLNFRQAAEFMLNGLMTAINRENDKAGNDDVNDPTGFKARASNVTIDGDTERNKIISNHRGD